MKHRTTYFSAGFTLVEMAIVLLILGIALGGLLGAVGQSTENTRRLEAKNKLREIEEALYGFAQIYGRLPCPANWNTDGLEDIAVGNLDSGDCNMAASNIVSGHGLLPNATLGLSGSVDENGLLEDPWGNPYRYSVAGQTDGTFKYTGTDGILAIYDGAVDEIVYNANMLRVCNIDDCSDVTMIDVAPAVVLSMGKNWGEIGTASDNEEKNASGTVINATYSVTNTPDFVVTGYSEENFDDMLVWISPHLLLSRMITAGKLP